MQAQTTDNKQINLFQAAKRAQNAYDLLEDHMLAARGGATESSAPLCELRFTRRSVALHFSSKTESTQVSMVSTTDILLFFFYLEGSAFR